MSYGAPRKRAREAELSSDMTISQVQSLTFANQTGNLLLRKINEDREFREAADKKFVQLQHALNALNDKKLVQLRHELNALKEDVRLLKDSSAGYTAMRARGISTDKRDILSSAMKTEDQKIRTENISAHHSDPLEEDVRLLEHSSDEYTVSRDQWISTVKRDIFSSANELDYQKIKTGNISAHHSDPLADALLYKKQLRHDDRTYYRIYTLGWTQVLNLGQYLSPVLETDNQFQLIDGSAKYDSVINLLAQYATMRTQERPPNEDVTAAFWKFIHVLETDWISEDPETCPESNLAQAYRRFYSALRAS